MTNTCVAAGGSDDSDTSTYKINRSSSYWLGNLLLRILFVSLFLCLGVVGLISYFWRIPAGFEQGDLTVFLLCFFIIQMVWHYFSLFQWKDEGVVRNQQSVWMFFYPNRLLITSLTIFLAVIVFYWNYLFMPEKYEFIFSLFLIIFLPQLFVRIWDVLAKKETSLFSGLMAIALVVVIMAEEIRYGIGFRYMTAQVEKVAQLESKPGKPQGWDIPIPDSPRWKRDGMTYYPQLFEVLNNAGFQVDKDTHLELTPQAKKLFDMGIIPFNHYQGKAFSGLQIIDRHNETVYQYQHPNQFKDFKHISPFILKALLVWENDKLRHMVFDKDNEGADLNYLIEGPRIIKSASEYIQYKITGEGSYSGGSTLMTTLEKITNTPGGRTQSVNDKINQMIGAGLHLYGGDSESGSDKQNTGVQKGLVDFLNTVPMAGGPKSHSGELFGFGASYYAWFGYTIDELNEQLKSKNSMVRAQAFKNICSLIVSIRRPSELLGSPEIVDKQANLLLSRLNKKKLLNSALYVKSRVMKPAWNPQRNSRHKLDYALHREASSARNQYTHLMRQAVAKKSGRLESKKINLQTVDAMPVALEMTTDAQLEKNIRNVLDDMYTELAQKSPFVQGKQKGLLHSLNLDELK
ncbi:MAG: transglycosylase domain-containing protein [Gammaproteobacteria bacterium]|nr:transglycosylase domain-containing protein [Gammaproteobacteria bacterium]